MLFNPSKVRLPRSDQALAGRAEPMPVPDVHFVLGAPLTPPFPAGVERILFGMGCFWGAERKFWNLSGVFTTAVGYAGGHTPNPTYHEVCTGNTAHTEVVLVAFDPRRVPLAELLNTFWESHDPTQGMRQGNDAGTQYRSAIYTYSPDHLQAAQRSKSEYQIALTGSNFGEISTEVAMGMRMYYAESYHQQYLAKNTDGYCGIGGTGVRCSTGEAT
jgi:peptide-methionine (S)-S-oxide reductase